MAFDVVVDSCCDMTPEMIASGRFHNIPLTIYVGQEEFVDDYDLDVQLLADAMAMCQEASHTACPSPADYLAAYEACPGDIYVVTLSALLSGSHNSAWQAAQLFLEEHPGRNIRIFNSCSAVSGETLIAMKIAELAETGISFDEVAAAVDHFIADMETLFVLDNLDTLRKAGRLTKVQSLITGALRVKLVMGATPAGEICKHGQALSIKQALSKIVDRMATDEKHRGKVLVITHCLCPDRAETLAMLAKKSCDFSKIVITKTRGLSTFYANTGGVVAAY